MTVLEVTVTFFFEASLSKHTRFKEHALSSFADKTAFFKKKKEDDWTHFTTILKYVLK